MVKTIWAHHDADGITSAYMTKFGYPDAEVRIVEKFGDTSEWKKGDIMVDMRPDNPEIEGLVIDHHPGHPPLGIRKYELIFDHKPASLVCFEHFKDKIPKEEWWKVAVGVVGDGQPEKLTYEVWESCVPLMKNYSTYVSKYKMDWSYGAYPVYQSLSSPINAFCRVGKYNQALEIMKQVQTPMELIKHPAVKKQKKDNNTMFRGIMSDAEVFELPNLRIIVYSSKNMRVSGWVASVLGGSRDGITNIAINEENGSISVRGDLANYFKGLCKAHNLDYITFDGHDGFMGGKINGSAVKFYYDLMEIL